MAEMRSHDVVELLDRLEQSHVAVWFDGGWAVDAVLGEQTRPHADVDIVLEEKHVATLRRLLEEEGYRDVPRDDTSPWNFVLGDGDGHEVDLHVVVLDADGNGVYGPAERGVTYPAASLRGVGHVDGRRVRCITAEYLVQFHTGYTLRDRDFHDVSALCRRFGIDYPEEHRRASNEGRRP